jgi:hypothetical protein
METSAGIAELLRFEWLDNSYELVEYNRINGKPRWTCLSLWHKEPETEDAEGLQKAVLLAEGARVIIARNVWTSKGEAFMQYVILYSSHVQIQESVNGAQGTVKKIWFQPGSNPQHTDYQLV